MRIAIFENQYHQVEQQFMIANKIFFDNSLEIDHFNSSQLLQPLNAIVNYALVIVDISLSSNSDRDGFHLIEQIKEIANHPKILILTGNSHINEILKEKKLGHIPVIYKPVDVMDIGEKLKKVLSKT